MSNKCSVCLIEGKTLKCPCGKLYCSKECQRKDWLSHKTEHNRITNYSIEPCEFKETDELNSLKKELEAYFIDLKRDFDTTMFKNTIAILNGALQGEITKVWNACTTWFNDKKTKFEFIEFMRTNKHMVNGEEKQWSCGEFGSRWLDITINGYYCRVAFYSKVNNPEWFTKQFSKNDYILMLDPTYDRYFSEIARELVFSTKS